MNRMGRISICVLASIASLVVAGCNTVEGVGRDLQAAGAALSRSAQKIAGVDNQTPTASREETFSGSSTP